MGQVRMSMKLRDSILDKFKKQFRSNNPDPFTGVTQLNHVIIEGLRNSPVRRFMDELTNHPFLKHYNLNDNVVEQLYLFKINKNLHIKNQFLLS